MQNTIPDSKQFRLNITKKLTNFPFEKKMGQIEIVKKFDVDG